MVTQPKVFNYTNVILKSAKYVGFDITFFKHKFVEAFRKLGKWMEKGKIRSTYVVYKGVH
jgi:NADPH-dependent curcumin reductase CurA